MVLDCGSAPINAISKSTATSCFQDSGYLFYLLTVTPSAGQISRMCNSSACSSIFGAIVDAAPNECKIETKTGTLLLYEDFLRPIYDECGPSPTPTTVTPVVTTPSPVVTTSTPATTTTNPSVRTPTTPSTISTTDGSSSNTTTIVAVVAGVMVVVIAVIVAFLLLRKKRSKDSNNDDAGVYVSVNDGGSNSNGPRVASGQPRSQNPTSPKSIATSNTAPSTGSRQSSTGGYRTTPATSAAIVSLTNDQIIKEAYVPLDEVYIGDAIGQGAFGEVLHGQYNGLDVAVKRLIPARRRDAKQIVMFLEEAKLVAMLDHPRIVDFLGVSWRRGAETLESVCILTEFMEGGDLRSMLAHADETNQPEGLTSSKLKIATQIADALVYLHGLASPVVHRDLKSTNVLLTRGGDAKLTDFGVARERVDVTMTAGVGTYLWMAPEVIFSKRYDEKADIYSLGVVLAELDTQKLPYAYAAQALGNAKNKPTELSIMTAVSNGSLSVSFSDKCPIEVVAFARTCLSVDPTKRPSAKEALARLQLFTRKASTLSSRRVY